MALKRLFQVLAARELQAGLVPGTLLTAANANLLVIDPQLTYSPTSYDRQVVRGTFSPLQALTGLIEANLKFGIELSGVAGATAATAPGWSVILEACGFRVVNSSFATIGAISTGTNLVFEHGEIVTATGTPNHTATVLHDTWNGQTVLRFIQGSTPIANADAITGSTNGSTATISSVPAEGGWTWFPNSTPTILFTGTVANGNVAVGAVLKGNTSGALAVATVASSTGALTATTGMFRVLDGTFTPGGETVTNLNSPTVTITSFTATAATPPSAAALPTLSMALVEDGSIKIIKNCRGTVKFNAQIGQPCIMNFEFTGVPSTTPDGAALGGVAYTAPIPAKFLGSVFKIGANVASEPGNQSYTTEHTPRISSFAFDLGQKISTEKDATATTGIVSAAITDRNPTFTMDPENRPEGAYPFIAKMISGLQFRARAQIGTVAGNIFFLTWPSLRATAETPGNRDGFATRQMTFDNAATRATGSDGVDCEFVMTYSIGGTGNLTF